MHDAHRGAPLGRQAPSQHRELAGVAQGLVALKRPQRRASVSMRGSSSANRASFEPDRRLRNHLAHQLAVDIRQAEIAPLEAIGELRVIEAQEMENGGLQIVDVHAVFHRVKA